MQPQTTPYTQKEFNDKYWFGPMQMVTVRNPKTEEFPFMVEMRHFVIGAGAEESFPGPVANLYLRKMSRILAQDEDKMQFLSDPNLMRHYYDRLIVSVKDYAQQPSSVPSYLRDMPSHTQVDAPDETPPWEKATDVPPVTTEPEPVPPAATNKPKAETKEFELNGLKFKMVTDEEGVSTFFKNDLEIDEAAYAKAASMI